MKIKLLSAILFGFLMSCSKGSNSGGTSSVPAYFGTYNNAAGDGIVTVAQGTGIYIKITWTYPTNGMIFDSVKVASDLTFTVNQVLKNQPYSFNNNVTAIGTGSFGANTIHFNFTVGGTIIYDGVRH